MISARMERQLPDLGIRKAFGASRRRLLVQIIWENSTPYQAWELFSLVIAWIVLALSGI